MAPPSCSNCMFSEPVIVEQDGPALLCRRYPPLGINEEYSEWPAVHGTDWCGEHKLKDTSG